MSAIITNILEFEGKPFIKPLRIIEYKCKNIGVTYSELGKILRNLRRVNRDIAIIQYEKYLLTVSPLRKDVHGSLAKFEERVNEIKSTTSRGRDIIRRLMGESIAVQLRMSLHDLWKVEETQNNVFEVSRPKKIQKFGEIDLFPGFHYSPIVLSGGEAGVIIDPKHKFHASQDLRTRESRGLFNSSNFEETTVFIDVCPLSFDECSEKRDPYSTCKLAGTGTTVPIRNFIKSKPSDVILSIGENLIEYHNRTDVCL
ncbi:unnamed protein product, partial [marine sediment metagenome]